ncbi:hypothetical protein DRN75_02035 [Nanoarchaeota archaeon]|nr:MAG: hypothetical protein DRN75_02035 [Nanoarchaeota archaeon]
MGIDSFFKKIGSSIGKQVKKSQINLKQRGEIRTIKEKYLSKLSHRELVQIYKTYLGNEA